MTSSRARLVVGLDVHKETIFAATVEPASGEIGKVRQFKNAPDRLSSYISSLQRTGYEPEVCYEASSCGYVIYRQLAAMDVACDVIPPSCVPKRPGDRVKTDRRDAIKLATLYASGLLESVEVPDAELEQMRALSRCRSTLVEDLTRLKHRTTRLLESRGYIYREGTNWTLKFWSWLRSIGLDGEDQTVLEVWMNAMERRQEGAPPRVVAISWKAQQRLHKRFHALAFRKPRSVANVAVARELVGFLWAALQHSPSPAPAAA